MRTWLLLMKNFCPVHHYYPIPVVLVPVITHPVSSGGREEMFALNLPALQSCKSGLPTVLIWGFFPGGGRGKRQGLLFGRYWTHSHNPYSLMQTEEYQDTFLRHFKLFYSYFWCQRQTGGYSDGIFSNLFYGKLLSEGRNTALLTFPVSM